MESWGGGRAPVWVAARRHIVGGAILCGLLLAEAGEATLSENSGKLPWDDGSDEPPASGEQCEGDAVLGEEAAVRDLLDHSVRWDNDTVVRQPASPACCVPGPETIDVCGRQETIVHTCKFPVVTPAMAEEAKKHPELREEYERVNACVSTEASCKAYAPKTGGSELEAELLRLAQAKNQMPQKIRFHFTVTNNPVDRIRDDMAVVSRKGFVRDLTANFLLYRLNEHEKFHEDAEGVALVAKKITDHEREELLRLSNVLTEMETLFNGRKDEASAENSRGFAAIARQRALEMEAVSCELDRMAKIDRERQERMRSMGELVATNFAQGSGSSKPGEPSDVSGTGNEEPGLADPGDTSKIGAPAGEGEEGRRAPASVGSSPAEDAEGSWGASKGADESGTSRMPGSGNNGEEEEVLAAFGPDPGLIAHRLQEALGTGRGAGGIGPEDESLFSRVHRQHRARERQGHFYRTILD